MPFVNCAALGTMGSLSTLDLMQHFCPIGSTAVAWAALYRHSTPMLFAVGAARMDIFRCNAKIL